MVVGSRAPQTDEFMDISDIPSLILRIFGVSFKKLVFTFGLLHNEKLIILTLRSITDADVIRDSALHVHSVRGRRTKIKLS